jgi:hypothetical protein
VPWVGRHGLAVREIPTFLAPTCRLITSSHSASCPTWPKTTRAAFLPPLSPCFRRSGAPKARVVDVLTPGYPEFSQMIRTNYIPAHAPRSSTFQHVFKLSPTTTLASLACPAPPKYPLRSPNQVSTWTAMLESTVTPRPRFASALSARARASAMPASPQRNLICA